MKKNDKVKIVGTGDIWEGKTGVVIDQGQELITVDGDDLTEVTVRVKFDTDDKSKFINQIFARKFLELESASESLKEDFLVITDLDRFKNYFLGKECKFKGFDYDEIFCKKEQDNGDFDYDEDDLAEINYFKDHENKPCKIINCLATDGYDDYASVKDNFDRCYWDVDFGEGEIIEGISGANLITNIEAVNESFSYKNIDANTDIIRDYVYLVDMNDEDIPSWFFAGKIAAAEGISEEAVLDIANELKYKIFKLECGNSEKFIIAAKGCKQEDIMNDYGDYLLGPATICECN